MVILFPSHPIKARQVEPDFETELEAATSAGFPHAFYSHEAIINGDAQEALAACPQVAGDDRAVLLRGWMIPGETYRLLYEGLHHKGYEPVTKPTAFEEAHYLPSAYAHIRNDTAESGWIEGDDPERAWQLYQSFKHQDAVIKDWVKSAKHRWSEACFIPAGTTRDRFREIFQAFRAARGDLFNRGVVIRRYHRLIELGHDIRGLPVVEEYRLFLWRGSLIASPAPVGGNNPLEEMARWSQLARKFDNPFLTIDVARREDQHWMVIEVGDGGVSGLPSSIDTSHFYVRLREQIRAEQNAARK